MSHTEDEIKKMISENNYSGFDEFVEATFVGLLCGHCLSEAGKLFEKMK